MIKILKLAILFEKQAQSVTQDIAIRIIHSLIPEAVGNDMDARDISVKLTSVHLINVAKRYVNRGCVLIKHELKNADHFNLHNEDLYSNEDIIQIGKREFAKTKEWDPGFGGLPWYNFSCVLEKLNISIQKFEQAKNENNSDKMFTESGLISGYMNVLDGMVHNTGLFVKNMIVNEETGPIVDYNTVLKQESEAVELMDSKELSHIEDILPFLKKYITNNPEAYLYKELYSKLTSKHKPNLERTKKEINIISKKKNIINNMQKTLLPVITLLKTINKNPWSQSVDLLSIKNKLKYVIYKYATFIDLDYICIKYKEAFSFLPPSKEDLPSLFVDFVKSEDVSQNNEVTISYMGKIYIVNKEKQTAELVIDKEKQVSVNIFIKPEKDIFFVFWIRKFLAAAEEMYDQIINGYIKHT